MQLIYNSAQLGRLTRVAAGKRSASAIAKNREAAGRARTIPRRIRGAGTLTRPRHIFRKIHPTFWLRCNQAELDLLFFFVSRSYMVTMYSSCQRVIDE